MNEPQDAGAEPVQTLLQEKFSRRGWIASTALGAVGVTGFAWMHHNENFHRADTVVVKQPEYDHRLTDEIRRGLEQLGFNRHFVRNKSVVLKPNLVEPAQEAPHINTHPEVIRAVADVFRHWDARSVVVAEGQGHIRDSWLVLEQSGLETVLAEAGLSFIDLNHDAIVEVDNPSGLMKRKTLFLPRTVVDADLVVSLPKMKTHHWAGVTLSMKNLFGVMPGICYGWPKNVLHYCGIEQSILDIVATVKPHLAIVDGIVGMEGDGPIMGTARQAGVIVMGTNLVAVDATTTRLMGVSPRRIKYLKMASGKLGPIEERHISQRGETIADCTQSFEFVQGGGLQPA